MIFLAGLALGLAVFLILLYAALIFTMVRFSVSPIRIYQYLSPAMLGLRTEDIELQSEDGLPIRGWWREADSDTVVIFVHGYIANRCEYLPCDQRLDELGVSSFYIDTRAQGRSGGTQVGLGWLERFDVAASIDFVVARKPEAKILLVGSSMGGAACIFGAVERPGTVAAIIADGTYRSLPEAVEGWWKFVGSRLISILLTPVGPLGARIVGVRLQDIRTDHAITKLPEVDFVLMVGDRDPILSVDSAREMVAKASPGSRLEVFEGCTHGQPKVKEFDRFWLILLGEIEKIRAKIPGE